MDGFEELESPDVELEATEAEGAAETTEQSEEVAEGSQQQTTETEPATAADSWRQIKELLKDKPALHGHVKKALRHMETFNSKFPEGIEGAIKRLEVMQQLDDNPDDPEYVPGSTPLEDVISNTLAERTFWRDYDTAYQAADPKVINQMVEANPEAFQKLITPAIDRFAEINPAGYSTMICQGITGYINNQKIPLQLALLEQILPPLNDPNLAKDPGLLTVVKAFTAIKSVFETIESTAKKQIEIKAGGTPQNQNQPDVSLETREINLLHDEWLREIRPRSESFTVNEVQKQFPGKRFTPAEVSQIRNAVKEEVNARVRGNSGYQGKVKAYLKAKNKTAYAMTVESEHKKIIPGAVKRAVQDVIEKRQGTKKKTAQQTQNNGNQTRQQQNGGQSGATGENFELIAQSPTRMGLKVDFRRGGMLESKGGYDRAYVVGREKPVQWKARS
jgi:hypothetical protein